MTDNLEDGMGSDVDDGSSDDSDFEQLTEAQQRKRKDRRHRKKEGDVATDTKTEVVCCGRTGSDRRPALTGDQL
jgi:hypothetical protein